MRGLGCSTLPDEWRVLWGHALRRGATRIRLSGFRIQELSTRATCDHVSLSLWIRYGLSPSGRSASFADSSDEGIGKKRIDEWYLGEPELPFALQFGQQVPLPEQEFGTFAAQCDFGCSFGVDAKD